MAKQDKKQKAAFKRESDKITYKKEQVNHPSHYQHGNDNTYETIKVIRAWGLDKNFNLANSVKYLSRAGKKDTSPLIEDLKKALWYLNDEIKHIEEQDKKLKK